MTYVMSDLHGQYEKYISMLDKIGFCDDDTLYVLGDIVDRGDDVIKLLKDMMSRSNVLPIMGNHDFMALHIMNKLAVEITEENFDTQVDTSLIDDLLLWQINGGQPTIDGFQKLSAEERADILDYIEDFPYYDVVEIGEKCFILVHSGLGNFQTDKELYEYTIDELAFKRSTYDTKYFSDNVFVVSGHTPTLKLTGQAKIYHNCNNICIDCGACFSRGKLACLCLDTMEEFYV